ncbi:MAG: class II D-tagatose-bisphosphate aldolase, non-catalytic subunit [Ignisphaera sp.]|nr:class II D-tagatose-bisphosphate aldolase, non-catalytic subunit [Ignisphaera sp.]MCX8167843.1 class II D-tagatose-bisphosphate aldolase, non-catalytic subunit [Ignisphaera sp.]MDW8086281.1 class II D-tagatose-bisphosphate aldolase, non-catalytic subunit [Ignisphaera sp.]
MEINSLKFLLNTARRILRRNVTLLCVSPISWEVVVGALKAAKSVDAPIVFAASLNQINSDGGYTGWTPERFVELVHREVEAMNFNGMVFFEADHCGPWLRNEHVIRQYDYQTAFESVKKSIEDFINAGFHVLHIDTSIDRESSTGFSNIDVAARRTVELIDCAEDLAKNKGIGVLEYEVGSDRWSLNSEEEFRRFISLTIGMLKSRNIDISRIVFAVADVGTRVRPGNRLDIPQALKFINVLKDYDMHLKIHSADYLENPHELARNGIGGINIGPMFAHIQYRTIKDAVMNSGRGSLIEIFKDKIERSIVSSDKLGRYFTANETIEEYKIGLASRYIWSKSEIKSIINLISRELGIDISRKCMDAIEISIRNYLMQLNLKDVVSVFKTYNRCAL